MAELNPLIPMSVQPSNFGNALMEGIKEGRAIKSEAAKIERDIAQSSEDLKLTQLRSQLVEQQTAANAKKQKRAEEDFNLKSLASGALAVSAELNHAMQSGDTAPLISKMEARAKAIAKRGGDPQDTLEGIESIKSGGLEQFASETSFAIQEATTRGLISGRQDAKWGKVIEGVGEDGKAAFFQADEKGNTRQLPGFSPTQEAEAQTYVEVVDPNNPAKTKFVPKGEEVNFQPKGNVVKTKGAKARTAGQQKEEGFYDSMVAADKIINALEATEGFDPVVWDPLGLRPNFTIGTPEQKYTQAGKQWIRAKLRSESGATISDSEVENEYSTYFPSVGDKAETIAQKKAARAIGTQSMRKKAGLKTLAEMTDEELEAML